MTFVPHGRNLVAGDRIESEDSFFSAPVRGVARRFCAGSPDLVDRACQARIVARFMKARKFLPAFLAASP